jgi:hypothetical protein
MRTMVWPYSSRYNHCCHRGRQDQFEEVRSRAYHVGRDAVSIGWVAAVERQAAQQLPAQIFIISQPTPLLFEHV